MIVHYIEIKHPRERKLPSVMQFFHGARKCFAGISQLRRVFCTKVSVVAQSLLAAKATLSNLQPKYQAKSRLICK